VKLAGVIAASIACRRRHRRSRRLASTGDGGCEADRRRRHDIAHHGAGESLVATHRGGRPDASVVYRIVQQRLAGPTLASNVQQYSFGFDQAVRRTPSSAPAGFIASITPQATDMARAVGRRWRFRTAASACASRRI
jgi:hypothetical protein